MAGQTKTTTTEIAYAFRTHFSKELLERMKPVLVFADHGLRSPLPKNEGAKTVRMMRFTAPSTSDIQTLTEGTVPASSTHKQLALEYLEVTPAQYGQSISITDVLDGTSLFDMAKQATLQNAEDAALHCDTIVRNELTKTSGTNGTNDLSTRGVIYANGAANYAAVYNSGTKSATLILTATDILDGATTLKVKKAPRINGSYVMAVGPQGSRDIMAGANSNTLWKDVGVYSNKEQVFNGEVGKLYGVRIVEHTEPYRSAGTQPTTTPSSQYSASGVVFTYHMFGRNAYGVTDLSTLGSPMSPQVYYVTGADKSDPLNQIKMIVSFKTYFAAVALQPQWYVQLYSQSGSAA